MKVFCALMTMTGRFGRIFLMRGSRSNAFSSGITTSVMTRSPSPWLTQRQSVAALPVDRTSYPARDSAWLSTVRIAVSSSATRMLAEGIGSLSTFGGFDVARVHGHEHTKRRAAGLRLALDDAAVVAHDLRHQCKTEAASARLGRHERIEQMRHELVMHAGAIVLDAEFE